MERTETEMCSYALPELVEAVARERKGQARQTHPHKEDRPKIAPRVISVTVFPGNCC